MSKVPGKLPPIFGQRIQRAREDKGWSMRELSARCGGVSPSTIMRAEQGMDLALSSAILIADALGCSMDALLNEPDCGRCLDAPPPGFICGTCGKRAAA